MAWSHESLPRLDGRTIIVTGGNSGIGFEAAWMLAARGASLILACRNPEKAAVAVASAREKASGASVEAMALDLASLSSVRAFAGAVRERFPVLHGLVNNAGVMATPFRKTADGFELQLGTNHFGHFALTGLLFPLLVAGGTPQAPARVVNVASTMHRPGRMYWDDLDGDGSYEKWSRYSQSKLANLLFTFELDRRLQRAGLPVVATAAHPGYAATNLQSTGPNLDGATFGGWFMAVGNVLLAQSAQQGAWPTVYAAAGEVAGGDYIGPGFLELWGAPKKVGTASAAKVVADQQRLWTVSEARTGVAGWLGT